MTSMAMGVPSAGHAGAAIEANWPARGRDRIVRSATEEESTSEATRVKSPAVDDVGRVKANEPANAIADAVAVEWSVAAVTVATAGGADDLSNGTLVVRPAESYARAVSCSAPPAMRLTADSEQSESDVTRCTSLALPGYSARKVCLIKDRNSVCPTAHRVIAGFVCGVSSRPAGASAAQVRRVRSGTPSRRRRSRPCTRSPDIRAPSTAPGA